MSDWYVRVSIWTVDIYFYKKYVTLERKTFAIIKNIVRNISCIYYGFSLRTFYHHRTHIVAWYRKLTAKDIALAHDTIIQTQAKRR